MIFDQPEQLPIDESLLIASPSLRDGVFDNSVIYIASHTPDKGALGYILNRPTGRIVGSILRSDEFQKLKDLPIYYGGPVDEETLSFNAFVIHSEDEIECKVCISAQHAIELLGKENTQVRAFVGSSIWSPGQLEKELKQNAWYLSPAFSQFFSMEQDETLWKNTLQSLSPFHHLISLTPENPLLN